MCVCDPPFCLKIKENILSKSYCKYQKLKLKTRKKKKKNEGIEDLLDTYKKTQVEIKRGRERKTERVQFKPAIHHRGINVNRTLEDTEGIVERETEDINKEEGNRKTRS